MNRIPAPQILLTTAYFPPIAWFRAVASAEIVFLESREHFQKQSWRNRMQIAAADGPLSLVVPVNRPGDGGRDIREVRIDESTPWRRQHWRALTAAYRSSPFFEYYADEISALLERRDVSLFDLNLSLIRYFMEAFGLSAELRLTDEYRTDYGAEGMLDLREAFHPKRSLPPGWAEREKPYYQVFADRKGFVSGLSAADLLFNEGPESAVYLR